MLRLYVDILVCELGNPECQQEPCLLSFASKFVNLGDRQRRTYVVLRVWVDCDTVSGVLFGVLTGLGVC